MPRRKSKRRSREEPTVEGRPSSPNMVQGMTMGSANVTRRFVIDTENNPAAYNTPSMIMQRVRPMACMLQGWSKDGNEDFSDSSSVFGDVLLRPADPRAELQTLIPRTPYASYWDLTVWPLIRNLLHSGTGGRYNSSESELVRYFAHAAYAYSWVYAAIVSNYLTWHFDWRAITPGTPQVPLAMYKLNADLKADDLGMTQHWTELMNQVSLFILPTGIVREIHRTLSPFVTLGLGPKLIYPFPDWGEIDPWEWDTDGKRPHELAKQSVEYVQGGLIDTANLITNFLPFPIGDSGVLTPSTNLVDALRASAMHNTSLKQFNIFETEILGPKADNCLRFVKDDDGWGNIHYHSPVAGVVWGELKYSDLFAVDTTVTGLANRHWLMSPHHYSGYIAPSDIYDPGNPDTWIEIGNNETILDDQARYYKTMPGQRWLFADRYNVNGGFLLPETVVTDVPYEAALRAIRLQCEEDWEYQTLRDVTVTSMGSSLRELRLTFARMFSRG